MPVSTAAGTTLQAALRMFRVAAFRLTVTPRYASHCLARSFPKANFVSAISHHSCARRFHGASVVDNDCAPIDIAIYYVKKSVY